MTVSQAGERLIRQLVQKGRKPSTTENYASYLTAHIGPFFGMAPIAEITAEDIDGFIEACLDAGLSVKSTLNYVGFLHGIFDFAMRKRWATANPCDGVEKPSGRGDGEDIHFLDQVELDALVQATARERSRHQPATVERAAAVRQLRDVQRLPWKQIAARIGCAESTAIYLYPAATQSCASRTISPEWSECSTSRRR